MPGLYAQVFDHGERSYAGCVPTGYVTCTEVTVHIAEAKPRIRQGASGHIRMQLRERAIRRMTCGMFISADNKGFALHD